MKQKQTLIPVMILLLNATLCSSCATHTFMEASSGNPQHHYTLFTEGLWDATSARGDIIEVPFNEIFEADLAETDLVYVKNEERGYYYIEDRPEGNTTYRALRIIGTPVAVAADLCLEGMLLFAYVAGGAAI